MGLRHLLALLLGSCAFASVGACAGSGSTSPVNADGGPEAAPSTSRHEEPDAGPKTWCEVTQHDLCADFDRELDVFKGFDHVVRGDDKLHVDETGLVPSDRSAPYAFHEKGLRLPTPDGGQDPTGPFAGLFMGKTLGPVKTTKASLAFDLKVDENDDDLGVFELEGRSADKTKIIFFASLRVTSAASFFFASDGVESAKIAAPPSGRWVHVTVALDDQGTGKGTASLTYDGTLAGTVPLSGRLADSGATTLYVGISRTAPSGAYEVSYDNVALDMK